MGNKSGKYEDVGMILNDECLSNAAHEDNAASAGSNSIPWPRPSIGLIKANWTDSLGQLLLPNYWCEPPKMREGTEDEFFEYVNAKHHHATTHARNSSYGHYPIVPIKDHFSHVWIILLGCATATADGRVFIEHSIKQQEVVSEGRHVSSDPTAK